MKKESITLAALTALALTSPSCAFADIMQKPPVPEFAAPPRFAAPNTGNLAATAPAGQAAACDPGNETVQGNTVSLDLHLRRVDTVINNPSDPSHPTDQLSLRTYNGCLTSPEIEVKPGTSLQIALHNDLSPDDPTCGAAPAPYLQLPPGVGCFNTTNLHTHGLHVSPGGISDNVLLSVAPATTQQYRIDIPPDHPSGIFWYHAQQHGSSAIGLASADAGVLVVRGDRKYDSAHPHRIFDIDTILHGPDQQPFPENIFVLQQIPYACFWATDATKPYDNLITTTGLYQTNGTDNANSPWTCNPNYKLPPGTQTTGMVENFNSQLFSPKIWDTNGRFTSINGQVQPELTVPAGHVQRWRFVHAGVHDTIHLQIVKMMPITRGDREIPLSDALAGKARDDQEAFVDQVCNATVDALVPQLEIAEDGLTRTHIRTINPHGQHPIPNQRIHSSNYLQPGYRSDVLVVFPAEGDYCLLDQAAPSPERVNPSDGSARRQGPSIPQLLAYIHVRGGERIPNSELKRYPDLEKYIEYMLYEGNPELPDSVRNGLLDGDLTPWAPFTELAPPQPHPEPYVHFQIDDTNGDFTINDDSYDPNTVDPLFTRKVNTTDDWSVEVEPQPRPSPPHALDLGEPHIFHIPVNPFEVVDIKRLYYDQNTGKVLRKISIFDEHGQCRSDVVSGDSQHLADQYCGMYHVFRDTLFIENSFEATLRTHYARYTGKFALYCQILDHEDAGMMANVRIVDNPHPKKPGHPHKQTHKPMPKSTAKPTAKKQH